MVIWHIFKLNGVKECATLREFRNKVHVSIEFTHDQPRNDESKANSFGIDLVFLTFNGAEELE